MRRPDKLSNLEHNNTLFFCTEMNYTKEELFGIVNAFDVDSDVADIAPLGDGLINDTFKVTTAAKHYALQRINSAVFQNVDLLQDNIEKVTSHIREKLLEKDPQAPLEQKVLRFLPLKDSCKTYFVDAKGNYWRISAFIEGSHNISEVNEMSSRLAGEAFGEFEAMLVDMPGEIGETIPDFHNMPLRLRQLREAVGNDPKGRVAEVKDLAELCEEYGDKMCLAETLYSQGLLPKRICHCDTKVGNMLFDKYGKVLCVIDLDTVMPSFVFSDFGDFMRTAANQVAEDSPEYDKIDVRMDIFKAFTLGYLSSTKSFLTQREKEMLPYAVQLFAFMQAVRFLTDYINGDTYYKIKYPEHNLVRTRNQIKLFQSALKKEAEMTEFIQGISTQS